MKIINIILFILFSIQIFSQPAIPPNSFKLLPGDHHLSPLRGNTAEAKVGVQLFTGNNNMKVDVGNSIDILGFYFPSANARFSVGVDFMAYALITSYNGYQLQVDALDGFFGGNFIYSKSYSSNQVFVRLRILHHSGHLVDGHWDDELKVWVDNKTPIGYGRDLAELLFIDQQSFKNLDLRYFFGGAYAFTQFTNIKPLNRLSYSTGLELSTDKIIGKIFGEETNLFSAAHIRLEGIPSYTANQTYMLGLKLGKWDGRGLTFYFSYYAGGDLFSQYFTDKVRRFGVGFTIDFFH